MSNSTQKKQVFSVSQKYAEVFEILERVNNKSEFICQAIIEKYRGCADVEDSILEAKMKKILSSMMNENNLFIVSGNVSNVPIQTVAVSTPAPVVEDIPVANPTKDEDDEDDAAYLKNILDNM